MAAGITEGHTAKLPTRRVVIAAALPAVVLLEAEARPGEGIGCHGMPVSAAISPNDFASPGELSATLLAFVDRYNQPARPFNWNYTATDLARYLGRINGQQQPASRPEAA